MPETDGETALKSRRPRNMRRKARQMWALQHHRLTQIADRRMEPHFAHEYLFLWTLQSRRTANAVDFILPGLVFFAETLTNPLQRLGPTADDEAAAPADVTAS